MMLVITVCGLLTNPCDRIVQPVDNCIMSAYQAQVILAKTHLVEGATKIEITCGPEHND